MSIHVICFLFDPNIGGPTVRVKRIYPRMQSDGYQIRIAFPDVDGPAPAFLEEAGLKVDRVPVPRPSLPRKPLAFLSYAVRIPVVAWRVRRYLRTRQPDLVHINGAFDVVTAFGAYIARVPIVWHLNDTLFGARFSRLLGRFVAWMANVVVIASERVGDHYAVRDTAPFTIHAPVDVERFPARDPGYSPGHRVRLLLLGNWNWIKGQDRFINVLKTLRQEGVDAKGLVAGRFLDGQKEYWQPLLERIETEGLGPHFDAPGFVADPPSVLAQSDILLLTSHSEASPISLLEAMSVGLPVVSFDVGGAQEMLGHGDEAAGMVVPPGDVRAMADAAKRLIEDPALYRRMAESGTRRARLHYSVDACIDRHIAAYAAAMASNGQDGR